MLTRSEVRQQVIQYLAESGFTKTQLAIKIGINDRTMRRLVNSNEGVSPKVLKQISDQLNPICFKVIGFKTGKQYFAGHHKADCIRWINNQTTHGTKQRNRKSVHIALDEPMMVKPAS